MATAEELSKLISAAVDSAASAAGDAAEADRAVGALKQLQKHIVTAALLKETEAGKRVNKLTKHAVSSIASAAAAVVAAWKDCVKRKQDAKGTTSSGSGMPPRSGSFASTAEAAAPSGRPPSSGGAGADASQQQAQQRSSGGDRDRDRDRGGTASTASGSMSIGGGGGGGGAAAAGVDPPPKTGNNKRDKARTMMLDGLALCLGEDVEAYAPLGQLAAEVEEALWVANCEGYKDPTSAYLAKASGCCVHSA